jgi:internalin A
LQDLDLSYNQITDATPLEALLLNQKKVGKPILNISDSLSGNPLQTPPMEVINSGSDAFLAWVEENKIIADQDQKIILELEKDLNTKIPKATYDNNFGYTLNYKGRITGLNLSKGQIKHLPLIGKLTSLQYLNLSDNQITKIEGLNKLTSLQGLFLERNQITKIEGLDNLINLQRLYLSDNQITKIEGLNKLTSLQGLFLERNQITKIEGLDNLINLQDLDLWGNQITKIEGLDNLAGLRVLVLTSNQITKTEGLDNLTSLQNLFLHDNQIIKIEGLDNLINLQNLWLSENQITDARPLKGLLLNQKKAGKPVLDISSSLGDNPLQTPPVEVVKKGPEAFLEWVEENDK